MFLPKYIKKIHAIPGRESFYPEYKRKNPTAVKVKDTRYDYVADALTDKIGNRVKISSKKIVIPFNSEKDLERILEILDVEVKVD